MAASSSSANPSDLYFSPKTAFAADFLGNSNFFDADVIGRDGDCAALQLRSGHVIRAAVAASCTQGSSVRVMMRPERLRVGPAPSGSGANEVSGLVRDVVLVGGITRVYVDLPGGSGITASWLTGMHDQLPDIGAPLNIHWPREATLVFAGEERAQ